MSHRHIGCRRALFLGIASWAGTAFGQESPGTDALSEVEPGAGVHYQPAGLARYAQLCAFQLFSPTRGAACSYRAHAADQMEPERFAVDVQNVII